MGSSQIKKSSEQGYYMPETSDEFDFSALKEALNSIINFINEQLPNMWEFVDEEIYGIIKDGGTSPVAEVPCWECGEEYICVNEIYAEFGRCLNCGAMNQIAFCVDVTRI